MTGSQDEILARAVGEDNRIEGSAIAEIEFKAPVIAPDGDPVSLVGLKQDGAASGRAEINGAGMECG